MAFFGITSLGPPNVFQTSLINALGNLDAIIFQVLLLSLMKSSREVSIKLTKIEADSLLQMRLKTYFSTPMVSHLSKKKSRVLYVILTSFSVYGRIRCQS